VTARTLAWAGCAVALAVAAPPLRDALLRQPRAAHPHERLYFPAGRGIQAACLGFDAPVADYLWLQATQYYGGYRRGEHDLRYFDGLIDAVTRLDPRFAEAYRFASLVLCLDFRQYDRAVDVLKRGVLANPDDWQLVFDVGFVHYVFRRDDDLAAAWFTRAAAFPEASDFCRRFAAFAKRRGGDQQGSLLLWEELRRTTASEEMRQLADQMIEKCRRDLERQERTS
jgi:hypothetical protein